MLETQIDKPFRIVNNQWYNQFVFMRVSDSCIKNMDTDHVSDINLHLEVEYIDSYVPRDPERLKRYYSKKL
jgi:hypothetical protein